MTEADAPRFRVLLEALAAGWRVEVSEAWFHFYWLGLRSLSIGELEKAVERASAECKFMPAPNELRRLSGEIPVADRALRAWQAVLEAVRKWGRSYTVDFDDNGITNAAVRMIGGWAWLGDQDADQFTWIAKSFAKAYETVVEHGVEEEQKRPLDGIYTRSPMRRIAVGGAVAERPALDSQKPTNALPATNGRARREVQSYVAGLVEPDRRLPREREEDDGT